jgi:hypothetical protein
MLSAVLIVVQAGPLWGCGNRSAGGSTAPSTAMAPSEFAGVYQHPAGSEEAEARLTITPSGMTTARSRGATGRESLRPGGTSSALPRVRSIAAEDH